MRRPYETIPSNTGLGTLLNKYRKIRTMKPDIHPEYREITASCSCGHSFKTFSTLGKDELKLDVCAECHPFYTGKQKISDTAGRVERFRRRYQQ